MSTSRSCLTIILLTAAVSVQAQASPQPAERAEDARTEITVASDDGKIKGEILQFSPPQLENADKLAAPDVALKMAVAMGQLKPEWGVYEKTNGKYRLMAIGLGQTGMRGKVRVFHYGQWKFAAFGGQMFETKAGMIYAPLKSSKTKVGGTTHFQLRRCVPKSQEQIKQVNASIPGSSVAAVEVHYSPPSIQSVNEFLAGVEGVAIPLLIEDEVVHPAYAIYEKEDNGKHGKLLYRGKREPAKSTILYEPVGSSKGTFRSDGNGNLSKVETEP